MHQARIQLSTAGTALPNRALSRFEKVQAVIQKNFPLIWFSSKEIQSIYEQELKEPVSLSTVSTYLSRMAVKGMLLRTGGPNNLKYKTAPNLPQATIKQRIKITSNAKVIASSSTITVAW